SRRHVGRPPGRGDRRVTADPRRAARPQPAPGTPRHADRRPRVPVLQHVPQLNRVHAHAGDDAGPDAGIAPRTVLAALVVAWVVVLALYLRHAIVLSSD